METNAKVRNSNTVRQLLIPFKHAELRDRIDGKRMFKVLRKWEKK